MPETARKTLGVQPLSREQALFLAKAIDAAPAASRKVIDQVIDRCLGSEDDCAATEPNGTCGQSSAKPSVKRATKV